MGDGNVDKVICLFIRKDVFTMRFNQKELAFIALQPAETFDLQGLLWLKERDGYFWQRQRTECESLSPGNLVVMKCSMFVSL